ncbi:MAG: glucose-1-phosphate thymidylyltransferase [Candidatus Methanogaster sp.]|uniref:Glucose-1-phosphate thymidylyltransferase n=1 Tax=Candidatus Methanogaster sp. TaxID=3386292 RepID=A0AC61L4J3_9EURY|nr:MAG: glucose-1-phosphate thymidylyltransferase [ANME-2 cluster archaeon]
MKAVILAAGEGVRCRPLTLTRSKVMLPVANKPTVEYVVQALHDSGIKDIIMVVGYAKERIMNYFGNGKDFDVNIEYAEQKQQLGTAHTIKQVKDLVEGEFLVLNGDNLVSEETIADLTEKHTGGVSVLTAARADATGYALVEERDGKVLQVTEGLALKGICNVNTGIYIFGQDIFDAIEETLGSDLGEFGITDSIQRMIDSGYGVHAYRTDHTWMDVIHSWNLLGVNAKVLEDIHESVHETAEVDGKIKGIVVVGSDSIIGAGSYIKGPVIIGRDCEIGPNVVIAPSTSIGDNVTIEPFTYVRNSVILDNTYIGSGSTIKNSIIGENNLIKSHFITESGKNPIVELEGMLNHADELGTVLGDGNRVGCNISTAAGTLIGTECRIETGAVIRKQIPPHALVM